MYCTNCGVLIEDIAMRYVRGNTRLIAEAKGSMPSVVVPSKGKNNRMRKCFESDSVHGYPIRRAVTRIELAEALKAARREYSRLRRQGAS